MDESKPTLMQIQTSLPKKAVVTAAVMLVLIVFVYSCNIPNPNMILIAGLVFSSALFGYGGGVIAAAIMLFYSLFFFSTDHSFIRFTPQNIQKVAVTLIGVAVDMLLVCQLKRAELDAFQKVENLTRALHSENELLQHMSLSDALTGIRNRMALRQDFESYREREVTVMMLDLNEFKQINDTYGHDEGDRILSETGKLLADTFGESHCYRYGGDEFLVILPDEPETVFRDKLNAMTEKKPRLTESKSPAYASFSVGYVHGLIDKPDALQSFISEADEKMYLEKRDRGQRRLSAEVHGAPADDAPPIEAKEYTVREMKELLDRLSGAYDLARVVDPIERRPCTSGKTAASAARRTATRSGTRISGA